MLTQAIRQQKNNCLQVYDKAFAPADNYELRFFQPRICWSISIHIQEIIYCQGVAKFKFDLACELDLDEYEVSIYNLSQDIEYKKLVVRVYE